MSKAFDTVNHQELLGKFEPYGIQGEPLKLRKSYLSGPSQCIKWKDLISQKKPVNLGAPRGSVSGPILFILK